MSCLHAYTLTDPETNENPFDFYRWMLSESPVYFDPGMNMFVIASYDLIKKVALDAVTFSNEQAQLNQWNLRPGGMPTRAMEILDSAVPQVPILVTSDPPAHKRSRSLVQMAFTSPRVARMRDYIERIVNLLIDRFSGDGTVELVSQFAVPLPVYVISDQLGVPRTEVLRVKSWSDAVVGLRGLMGTDDQIVGYAEQLKEFQTYFGQLIAEKRSQGPAANDMLDDLINAQIEDERPLDHPELISAIQQLMVAGNESTTSAITSGIAIMLQNPTLITSLLTDDARMRRFVEEVLRLEPPVQGNLRRATADAQIGGVHIPKGSLIQLRHGAGNRDSAAFNCPDNVDVDNLNQKPHLAFGFGRHLCIGNALAREEMYIAFKVLLQRLANLRLSVGRNEFRHNRSIYIRGLQTLQLDFDPDPTLPHK
jgi:cytochrome P450